LLEKAEELIDIDVLPTVIVDGYRKASAEALKILDRISIKVPADDRGWLTKIAETSMVTKLVFKEADILAELVVDGLRQVAEKTDGRYKVDIDDVKVEKKPGGSLKDTKLIQGITLDKEVVHAGMPKRIEKPKIALLDTTLEIEKTEFDAKININNPDQIKAFLEEENRMLKGMVDKIAEVGANVAVCQRGIDDVTQHYLAKAGIMAARRVKVSDMEKLAKATGGRIVTNLDDLSSKDLGSAELAEERVVGGETTPERWVFIEGCKNPKSLTILIRGGTQRIVDEAERSVHDALMVVKDVMEKPAIVAGGGAPEAHIAHELREWSQTLSGREQLAAQKFAEALESIPLTLAENAGLDPIDTQVELRAQHSQGKTWYGVAVLTGRVDDMEKIGVIEPTAVKEQIVKSATEASCMILRIDDVIAASKTKLEPPKTPYPAGGEEGGMGESD